MAASVLGSSNPITLLLVWFLLHSHSHLFSANATHFSNETDRLSLLHFKNEINDDLFHSLSSWNDTLHFCHWQGVTCGGRRHPQRVTALDLMSHSLVGRVSTHIANLTFLKRINLWNNTFHGSIPGEIGHLFRLQDLRLTNNSLSGEIPVNLTHCSQLTHLDLYGNKLVGSIPAGVGSLSKLTVLVVGHNMLTGTIPSSLGNLSFLSVLFLSINRLNGNIPAELGRLRSLVTFAVGINQLSGTIPSSIYNISTIRVLDVLDNKLHGSIPPHLASTLPNLQWLGFALNHFNGPIPVSLSNATNLENVQLGSNHFKGPVPNNLGSLQHLQKLGLGPNQLGSGKAGDLNFLDSLTNCSNLTILGIPSSKLGGPFPVSIGNLSIRLQVLAAYDNMIFGSIPSGIGELNGLTVLGLGRNMLTGTIPTTTGKLNRMVVLDLFQNKLSGKIPASLCNVTQLSWISLYKNNLEGIVPSCLENCRQLQFVVLFDNKLRGTLPKQIFRLPSLIVLLVQNNSFSGTLSSEVGALHALQTLDASNNNLSGEIPSSLGDCLSLENLSLRGNFFQGPIPLAIISLRGLRYLDLSHNHLSGKIPRSLENLSLEHLDLSFNDFEGELPKVGVFKNATAISITGNSKLCGGIQELHLPACIQKDKKKSRISHATRKKLSIIAVILATSALSCFCISLLWLRKSRKKYSPAPPLEEPLVNVTYAELFKATDGFSSSNLIGTGSYGSVYKGVLDIIGTTVAVKVINLLQKGALKSFVAECEALRSIRHRNLLKILTCCSSVDFKGNEFKALVFEYMPNGSLDKWLHKDGDHSYDMGNLTVIQRLNIAIDVALALDYLHHHCQVPIVHRDLKPSNVLLDADMVAHISDFGLARFTSTVIQSNSDGINGSIGYVAPEYAMGVETSTQGDVYSYGILLLEMITGKEPTNDIFNDKMNIHHFVKSALPDGVMKIAYPQLLFEEVEDHSQFSKGRAINFKKEMHDCLSSMARIGVMCSTESPRRRMKINQVLVQLHAIRNFSFGVQKINTRMEMSGEGTSHGL